MSEQIMKKKPNVNKLLSFIGNIFILLGILSIAFVGLIASSSSDRLELGNVTMDVIGLKSIIPILLGFGVILLIFGVFIVFKRSRGKKIEYRFKDDILQISSSKEQYKLDLKDVDYLYLFRTPGMTEYGFFEDIGLYTKDRGWTIIGHSLESKNQEDSEVVKGRIIEKYGEIKLKDAEERLGRGESIVFPSLVSLNNMNDIQRQTKFDVSLIRAYNNERIRVNMEASLLDKVIINKKSITISAKEILFEEISEIKTQKYRHSVSKADELPDWMNGEFISLLNSDGEVIGELPLPSILNAGILYDILCRKID